MACRPSIRPREASSTRANMRRGGRVGYFDNSGHSLSELHRSRVGLNRVGWTTNQRRAATTESSHRPLLTGSGERRQCPTGSTGGHRSVRRPPAESITGAAANCSGLRMTRLAHRAHCPPAGVASLPAWPIIRLIEGGKTPIVLNVGFAGHQTACPALRIERCSLHPVAAAAGKHRVQHRSAHSGRLLLCVGNRDSRR